MPELILGPLLRYVGETRAVVWVETDEACEVSVLGTSRKTFCVEGHHYALVRVEDLKAGERYEYDVELDGEAVWPPADYEFPPPQFRTYPKEDELQIAFASCRVAAPSEPPYTLPKDEDDRGREHDALRDAGAPDEGRRARGVAGPGAACSATRSTPTRPRPRRGSSSARTATPASPPGEIALTFEEYTRLYRESWGEPVIRWLLSTVSSAMIFDDHDVHDDWNTSEAWLEEIARDRLVGRAHRRRADVVLDLPARREPEPGRAGRRRAARAG